ncbi:MAG: hypothetical protein QOF01_5091, partial [Thermomicrobiales bacterium]|nr:hypothetical protein [Thermomicrobiales bacterium]
MGIALPATTGRNAVVRLLLAVVMVGLGLAAAGFLRPEPTDAADPLYACYHRSSYALRSVPGPDRCKGTEREVRLDNPAHPVWICRDPATGAMRYAGNGGVPITSRCGTAPGNYLKVPAATETPLCVTTASGAVTWPPCGSGQTPVVIPRRNQPPTALALAGNSVPENAPNGTVIGTLTGTDPDPGATLTYSLANNAGGRFAVVGNELRVANGSLLDFEANTSHQITARVCDQFDACFSRIFTITVTNVNEAPTDIGVDPNSVAENQPAGTTVGTLTATDQDAGDSHTFALVAGAGSDDNGSFAISGNQLLTAASFDFETKSSYSIRVRATDAGSLPFEQALTVAVTNVNEQPTDLALDDAEIGENREVGTAVGLLSTTDVDAGDSFTYTLVSGTGSDDNASFQVDGDRLENAVVFDFEAKSSYTVRIRSTDAGGLFTEKPFTITIVDLNDAPTDIALSNSAVAENQPSGTAVGNLSTTDQDAGQTHTYDLVAGAGDDNNAAFQIVGNELQTAHGLNFEAQPSRSVRVRTTDSGSGTLTFDKVFTITVTEWNDAPTAAGQTLATNEDTPLAITLTGDDGDPGVAQVLTFAIDDQPDHGTLTGFDAATGAVTYEPALNYNGPNSFTVTVTDDGTAGGPALTSAPATIALTVNAVNDAPSFTSGSNVSVPLGTTPYSAPWATAISPGPADEVAAGQTVHFEITANSNGALFSTLPAIAPDGALSFTLQGSSGSANITVVLVDSGSNTAPNVNTSASVIFTISVNAPPTISAINDLTIAEDGSTGALAFTVGDTEDGPNSLGLSVTSNNTTLLPAGTAYFFGGSGASRTLTVTPAANRFGSALITVTVADSGNASATEQFTLTVDPVADPPSTTAATTNEDTLSSSGLVITRNGVDGAEVTHVKITAITNGTLYQNDGTTQITNGSFITVAEGNAGLRFWPGANLNNTTSTFSFDVQGATSAAGNGLSTVTTASISVTPVNDAPVVTTDTGTLSAFEQVPTAVSPGLTIADVDSPNITGATVRFTAGYVTGQDSLGFATQFGITGNFVPGTGVLTLSGTTTRANYETALRSVTYTNTSNTPDTATTRTVGFVVNDGSGVDNLSNEATRGLTVIAVNDAPLTTADAYNGAVGNTLASRGVTVSAEPVVALTGNVLTQNDADPEGDIVSAVAETVTSTGGGTATINTDGTFTFLPGPGDKNQSDTFTYHATDGTDSAAGTVTVQIANVLIWYVDNSASPITPDGRSRSPFTALSSLVGASDPDGTGDTIFVYQGSADYTGGFVLESSQLLFGQPHGLTVNNGLGNVVLVPAGGTNPVIAQATGTALALSSNNTLDSVTIDAAAGSGVLGGSVGTLAVSGVTVSATGGPALELGSGTVNGAFTSVSSTNSTDAGAKFEFIDGSFTVGGGSITGAAWHSFFVNGGTASITWSGSISHTAAGLDLLAVTTHSTGTLTFQTGTLSATTGNGILFDNADGTYNFNGTTTLNGGNAGIDIQGGSNGAFTFNAATSITSPSGTAFAVNGSVPTLTYRGNITQADNALLVDITGQAVTPAANDIIFQTGTLSATNGSGIQLSGVQGTVNFNGTTTLNGGNAGVDFIGGSQGTITFGTGATITSPTGSAFFVGASNPTVTYSGNITQANNALLVDVDIQGGTPNNPITFQTGTLSATNGAGIRLNNAQGAVTFNGTTTLNGGDAGVDITGGSLGSFTFGTGTTITSPTGTAFNVAASTPFVDYRGNITQAKNALLVHISGQANTAGKTITFHTGTLSATNGTGIALDNVDNVVNFFGTTTLNGGEAGINIANGSAGTITFGANASIGATSSVSGTDFRVSDSTGIVTYSGSINNNAGRAVDVHGHSSGTVTFSGSITDTGGAGVLLSGNSNTVNFTGTLNLNTGANAAFTSTNPSLQGIVSVNPVGANNNVLTTTTGTALSIDDTNISANGLEFKSISAGTSGSPANGIFLNNTGSSGGLTVTGSGTAGSGGTIQNTTGADGATAGIGIYLQNTRNVSLDLMQLNGHANYAIRGASVVNFTLANSTINGTNGTNAGTDDGSVRFTELTGSASVTNSNISGGHEDNFAVVNTSGVLDRILFDVVTIGANSTAEGGDGLFLQAD